MATVNVTRPLPVPGAGAEGQPGGVVTGAPGQGAAAGVADAEGLCAGLPPPWVAAKDRLVGLTPMAGGTGAAVTVKETGMVTGLASAGERDGAAMGAHGQGAGRHTHGHVPLPVPEVGTEPQPRRAFTGAPGQGAAAGVADAEGLRGGVAAALGGRKR